MPFRLKQPENLKTARIAVMSTITAIFTVISGLGWERHYTNILSNHIKPPQYRFYPSNIRDKETEAERE